MKALKRLGFTKENQEGSHIQLARGSLKVTVPNHKFLVPKTLKNVLRQAGISVEEFLNEL